MKTTSKEQAVDGDGGEPAPERPTVKPLILVKPGSMKVRRG